MRPNNRIDTRFQKDVARKRYGERQFDKWVKWSITNTGQVLFKDILTKQKEFNLINKDYEKNKKL